MGFNSFRAGYSFGAGLRSANTKNFALVESCDIQVDENGKRLNQLIDELTAGKPVPVESEARMNDILANATTENIGAIYKYTGETTGTYENGALYTIAEEA